MNHFQRMTCRLAGILALTLLPILTAMADEKFVKSQEPVFPAVQPDRALVYIVRPGGTAQLFESSTLSVFLDDKPVGFLPRHSYLAVQVEPGLKLLWGPMDNDSVWYEFKAGKTYLLLFVERRRGNYEERAWGSGDPTDLRNLVIAKKLSYVTLTEEGTAKLREEVVKEYGKVRKKAPVTAAATLPATFETVWYRPGKRGFSLRAYESTGTLTVSSETIAYKSDKKTITIPVKAIQAVSLDYVGKFDQANRWGIVRYSAEGSEEVVAFRDGHKLGLGGDTERIYLTLRSTVQSPRGSEAIEAANQSSREQPKQEGAAPEEQVVVTFDQRKWHVGYNAEKGGQQLKEFVLPEETVNNWTELVTVQSFLGAQQTAEELVLGMKQQLNECPKAMWKIIQGDKDEFLYEWQTVDCPGWDNQYEVSKIIKGRTAIHRIAYANRKLPIPEETRGLWIDLIGKAAFPAPRSVVQSTEVSTPQQPEKATAVPGEFVVYEGLKDQFTIAIPQGWAAYDQEQVVFRKTPGLWGIIIFLPAPVAQELKEFGIPKTGISESNAKELLRKAVELLSKVEAGEIPSFLVERVRADRGMSCSGFSEKAEKKLLQTIGRDPIFGKGRNVSERPHADPTTVGGCKGLRIRGRGQTSAGGESLVDIYAASDGETLYLFTLRPLAENYAKNVDVFQKAISTAKLSAAK